MSKCVSNYIQYIAVSALIRKRGLAEFFEHSRYSNRSRDSRHARQTETLPLSAMGAFR